MGETAPLLHTSPSPRPSSPLLRLPAELRLKIYSYVAPEFSLRHPPSQYTGLIYTCQQTRAELENEFLKGFTTFLNDFKDVMQKRRREIINFKEPTSIYEMGNFMITRQLRPDMFKSEDPFMPALAGYYFDCLTIKTREASSGRFGDGHRLSEGREPVYAGLVQRIVRFLARYLGQFPGYERRPSAQKIIFEFEKPSIEYGWYLKDAEWSLCGNEAWRMRVEKSGEGKVLRAVFEPAPGCYHAREKKERRKKD
ncbi:hypothetical protein BDV96DRAFT_639429 [Lophiotrema nucula]|uniref:Uncharacterized protein n=1 Tax=Lophiotrema nucula TaxID=690887 RepID=A0A6A5ZX54_9PLEO|nr:hypothetical protein BDV96DRAFT_639429 [Lophiotrema nucula]